MERVWRYFRRNVTDNVYFKSMKRLLHATVSFFTDPGRTPAVIQSIFNSA